MAQAGDGNLLLCAALEYAAKGFLVFPCKPRGKKPLTSNGFKNATTDIKQIQEWWQQWPDANIAISTGKGSNIIVLDQDGDYPPDWPPLPPTYTVKTGKGFHYYFAYQADNSIRNRTKINGFDMDIRADGGYVIAPPSIHPNGERYTLASPPCAELVAVPNELLDKIAKGALPVPIPPTQTPNPFSNINKFLRLDYPPCEVAKILEHIPANCDYTTWTEIGMALKDGGIPIDVFNSWSAKSTAKYPGQVAIKKKWLSFKEDGGITIATLGHYAKKYGYIKTSTLPPLPVPPSPLKFISPTQWQGQPVKSRRWIVEDWIPYSHVTALYGDGGTGKSLLAMMLLTATALGKPWLGFKTESVRALGIFCEDTVDELQRRQQDINKHFNCDFSALTKLHYASGVGKDNILMDFPANSAQGKLTSLYNFIEMEARKSGAQLIVVDTAADTFGGNENSRSQVRQFINALNRLALEINGAVLLCAHPSVAGMQSGRGDGGNTAWNNSVRSRLYLNRPTAADEPLNNNLRILTRKKANYSQTGGELTLQWQEGIFAVHTPVCEGVNSDIREQQAKTCFLNAMDAFEAQGRNLSASNRSGNYAPKLMLTNAVCHGFRKKELEEAMNALFNEEVIKNIPYGRPSNLTKKIVKSSSQKGSICV